MKRMKSLLIALVSILSFGASAQNNTTCADMSPICTDSVLVFPLNYVTSGIPPQAEVGPNYGCCVPQPNPSWFYFEISTAGDVNMTLSCTQDIDYVIWGPFADLATAQGQCGSLGVAPNPGPIDCNALGGVNNNSPTITGANVGEVYVMMVTNFSNQNTTFELTQSSGSGGTDCSIVIPPCVGDPGTFTLTKNGLPTVSPISLCAGETYGIFSNGDYTLPTDTISTANGGDSIYSAQLMFLLYTSMPSGPDPLVDPGYTGIIIPSDTIVDANLLSSYILDSLNVNCDTVYFVPVSGDDGIGANGNMVGTGDNGQVNFDLDSNGCYGLGTPIQVIYNCALSVNGNILCTPTDNTISINVNGGAGDVYAFTYADGILSDDTIQSPATVSLSNLMHLDTFNLAFVDEAGCMDSLSGEFFLPQFVNVDLFAAGDCNSLGLVAAEADPLSGNGGVVSITMNGVVETMTVPFDTLAAGSGTAVTIILTDAAGCTSDSTVSVPNATDSLAVNISTSAVSCNGGNDGTASVSAVVIDLATGQPSGTPIVSYLWISPTGVQFGGTAVDDTLTGMISGQWFVTITDATGCSTTLPLTINNPAPLNLNNTIVGNPTCPQTPTGSIVIATLGGVTPYTYSVVDLNGTEFLSNPSLNVANVLFAGTYIITVTDANGCATTISRTLVDPPLIDAAFNIKNVNCYGESTGSITAATVVNGVAPYNFYWVTPGLPNVPTTSQVANNLPAGTYSLTIVDDNGCENSWDFTITESDSIRFAELNVQSAFCRTEGFQTGNGVLSVSGDGGGGNFTYEWKELSTGNTKNTSTWAGRNPGTYQITITDNLGCIKTTTVEMDSVNPQAIFTVTSDGFDVPGILEGTEPLKVTLKNESIYFANPNNPNADTIFQWTFFRNSPDGDENWFFTYDIDDKVDTTYEGEQIFDVCLIAKNYNDCADTNCVQIICHSIPVLIAPNVFTPGEVPNNEFFFPAVGMKDFKCSVFNRYGVEVFEFNDISEKWDGNRMGSDSPCADGVYFYTYTGESTNGTLYEGQGTVTLIRKK